MMMVIPECWLTINVWIPLLFFEIIIPQESGGHGIDIHNTSYSTEVDAENVLDNEQGRCNLNSSFLFDFRF